MFRALKNFIKENAKLLLRCALSLIIWLFVFFVIYTAWVVLR